MYYSMRLSVAAAVIVCLLTHAVVHADVMGDECDWLGSGLSSADADRSVTPVYLRCTQGEVTWVYPRGALRVVLRLGSGREFRGCVRGVGAARLHLESRRSLHLLHGDDRTHCFTSSKGQAALYVEATRQKDKETFSFQYDLEPLPRSGAGFDPNDECRPCTSAEVARAYCASDLVTRGTISSVEHLDPLSTSRITVLVTKLLRGNAVDDDQRQVTMYRSRHCSAKHGPGEYVLMARRKLGDLALTCVTRLDEWATLRRAINSNDDAHCKLDT